MDNISLLKKFDLKATPQRISVLNVLSEHKHPTIDELYDRIREFYPSISLATVYKNLATLMDKGLVVEVNMPNQKTKYDIYEYPHVHVVCENCGHVEDMFFENGEMSNFQKGLEGKLSNFVEKFYVTASVKTCKHCS